jgi:hypothetical protein
MKLIYRGVDYEYTQPTLEVTEGEILGRYRGAAWRCQTVQELPIPRSGSRLSYRGVSYSSDSTASPIEALHPMQVAQAIATRRTIPCTTGPLRQEVARLHQANVRRNLEHRLQVAKQHGDRQLIALLEAERGQLA